MKHLTVFHYDSFSDVPNMGNPAGVVLNGNELTDNQMQAAALAVGFNETSFVVDSKKADIGIRFFTPGHEMNLCGHGTMAVIYALKSRGIITKDKLSIETKAGILPISIEEDEKGLVYITMEQSSPEFEEFNGSKIDLVKVFGIEVSDIDDSLPTIYGSTGIWTLLVPIKKLSTFKKMKPINKEFPNVLKEKPTVSIHPFCLETINQDADLHGRHFSSAFSGTIEDPVTGTASGVMGAYFAKYIAKNKEKALRLVVEQGQEMNKDGRVIVDVEENRVTITGTVVYVKEFEISI